MATFKRRVRKPAPRRKMTFGARRPIVEQKALTDAEIQGAAGWLQSPPVQQAGR